MNCQAFRCSGLTVLEIKSPVFGRGFFHAFGLIADYAESAYGGQARILLATKAQKTQRAKGA
jgi:hypothetical protein